MSGLIVTLIGTIFHNIGILSSSASSKRLFSKNVPEQICIQILEKKGTLPIVTKQNNQRY
jgi:hypothetical protein